MRIGHGIIMHKHVARIVAVLAIVAGTAHATPVPRMGTWETTLLGRDINGHAVSINDPSAEFAYDTVLDATWWLRAENIGWQWLEAKDWAGSVTINSFGGWSLPGIRHRMCRHVRLHERPAGRVVVHGARSREVPAFVEHRAVQEPGFVLLLDCYGRPSISQFRVRLQPQRWLFWHLPESVTSPM